MPASRAGLPPVGGHRLRHALASEMLRQGSDLVEISQVLRHRDLATTSVYAKVDRSALRAVARPWPGVRAMSALAGRAQEYLRIRRMLGHELAEAARLLPRFVAYLDDIGAEVITVQAALAWAQQPQARPGSKVQARRMTVARGFARHMAGIDPRTQVPPPGLLPCRQRWRPPFIYSDADIQALMSEVPRIIGSPLRAATYQTLIGLLAATGMRVGEALRLECGQIDWAEGVLTVHATKFGKSREVPLSASTVRALAAYARVRDQHFCRGPGLRPSSCPRPGRRWLTRISGRRSAASSSPAASEPAPRSARASMTCAIRRTAGLCALPWRFRC